MTKEGRTNAKPSTAPAENKGGPKAVVTGRKTEKITWVEQPKWRDGTVARLQGANAAYYLTRKIVSTRPRTAIVRIDGPAGFRMWVNGELAQTSLPPAPVAPTKEADPKATGAANGPDAKKDEKAEDDKEEPAVPEINDVTFDETIGRGRNNRGEKVPHRPPPG